MSLTNYWPWGKKFGWDHLSQSVQYLSLAVSYKMIELPFTKCPMLLTRCWSEQKLWGDSLLWNMQFGSQTVGHRKRHNETTSHDMYNGTHKLLTWEKMLHCCLSQNVQCHSLPVCHWKRCAEITFHKMYIVTHSLLVIANMWWDCLSQNHLQAFGYRKMCKETAFHKMCNITHSLYKRCDETAFHKMSSVTHSLLVIGKDVTRLPLINCAMSLTYCQVCKRCDMLTSTKIFHTTHILSVIRGKYLQQIFRNVCHVTHSLLVIAKILTGSFLNH